MDFKFNNLFSKHNIKKIIDANLFLIILIELVLIIYMLSLLNIIPNSTYLVSYLEHLYHDYGLLILFIITLIEGFLFFGLYFYGTAVIILAVIFVDGDIFEIMKIILTVGSALSIMAVINFIIGKKYSSKYLKTFKFKHKKLILLYFLHPTSIAYYCIYLGQNNYSYYSLILVFFGIFLSGIFYSIVITLFASLF